MTDPVYLDEKFSLLPFAKRFGNKRDYRICFGWYGGKTIHLKWLLPLLPQCRHYVEPFGGSAAILINKDRSALETYNDINGDLCNFFRCLRDCPDELIRLLSLSPMSREDYAISLLDTSPVSDIERARRFFVVTQQAFGGGGLRHSLGTWAACKQLTKQNTTIVTSRSYSTINQLKSVAERLATVQIENRPALAVIEKYDSKDTFFYCDPPYIPQSRRSNNCYKFDMSIDDHLALAEKLNSIKGKAAVSGYDCPQMDELFPPPRWRKVYAETKSIHSGGRGLKNQEVVWLNYDVRQVSKSLFK